MPVEISDWNDLDNVRNDLTGDYVLVNDLDSETNGYAGVGDDFEPIGFVSGSRDGDQFSGVLDGDGFQISDLVIEENDSSEGGVAFITQVGNGGLVENLSVDGTVDSTIDDFFYGGLAATVAFSSAPGTIQNCVSHVDVASDGDLVGGLVGENQDTVTESYATGSVEGDDDVGGLVGRNFDTVTDSYATGSVEGDGDVGGLVGDNRDTVRDSYWDTETSGQSTSDGGTGLTTAEMQGGEAETNMDGFDFTDVWDTVLESDADASADGYPILLAVDRENQLDAQGILVLFNLSVETNPATDISEFSATLNGELVELDDGAQDADVSFEFGESVTDGKTPTQTLTGPATFDELVDGLTNNTTFEFRAIAEAQDADDETFTDEGDILTFTTDDTQIDIQTDAATDVEAFEATLNGEVVNLGAYDSAETFFEYGSISVDDEVTDTSIIETAQTLSEVVELAQDTEHEFRAVAIGENDGVRYEGNILTFSTEIATLDGTISLDEAGVENADVLVHNFTQDVFEGRLSTDIDGNYAVDLPDADRLDTIAVAVDFDDGTERYGRVVTTVLE